MTARTALLAIAIATAAWLAAAPDARAQCRLCEKPTAAPQADGKEDQIELQVEAGLDFDRLVVMDAGEGSATLLPDGTRQVSGSVDPDGPQLGRRAHAHGRSRR